MLNSFFSFYRRSTSKRQAEGWFGLVTDRDHCEGAVDHACSYGGIDWTLDSCLHEDTGGVVKNLGRGANRLRWVQSHTALLGVLMWSDSDSLRWSQTAAGRAAVEWKWWWAGGRAESGIAPGWTPSSPCPSSSSPPSSLSAGRPPPAYQSTSSGLPKGNMCIVY